MRGLLEIFEELNKQGLIPKVSEEYQSLTTEERDRITSQKKCDIANSKPGNLNQDDGFNCDKCLNRGYWLVSRNVGGYYEEIMVPCKCRAIRKAIARLSESGLKNVATEYQFKNYKVTSDWQKSLLDSAKNFIKSSPGKWFFIGGQSGIGKSHLCTAITISLLKKGNAVKYMLWQDEARDLKRTLNEYSSTKELEEYKNVDVLYIDDLFKTMRENEGLQKPTLADIKLAFEILNARMSRKKTTVISSECTFPEIVEIDEAIAGRIRQLCGKEYCLSIEKDRTKNYRLR